MKVRRAMAASENAARLYGRFEIYCRKFASILAAMNGESRVSAGAVRAAYAWVKYCADTVDAVASTVGDRLKFKLIDSHATRIINALDRMGGVGKARDVSKAARLNAAEMKAAIGFLLTKAPAVIAVEERSVIGGYGAMQKVAWLRRL